MENVPLAEAREHLEDLMMRAARGEDVRIYDPIAGTVKLTAVAAEHISALPKSRELGFLKGIVAPPPDDFFDPMTEEELKDWYGDDV